MNHQIEHDVDIGPAMLDRSEPGRLDEAGCREYGLHRPDGCVEPLQMSHLQYSIGAPCGFDETLALLHGRGHGLFDQHMCPRLEKLPGDGEVVRRRSDDADRVDATQ